ncbi:MAG: lipid A export permease/ATP-binding protein MsbA [Gammaproteobacteria bacterium]|nr:lipid A export permease/ATP-binding protein MsbA [Gammaproteobacteria bacterium]
MSSDASSYKVRDDIKLYRRLLAYAWPYKWVFLIAIIGMAILASSSAGLSETMRKLVNEGFVKRNLRTMTYIPLSIIGIIFARAFGNVMGQYGIAWIARRVTFDLRQAMFSHLVHLPSAFYDAYPSGGLISKLIFDVEQIAGAVTEAVTTLVRDGLIVVVMTVYMLFLSWKLTLLFVVITPISTILMRVMSRRFRKASGQIQGGMAEISQVAQEAVGGQRIVKAFGAETTETNVFRRSNEHVRRHHLRKNAVSVIGVGLLQLVAALALASVIYFALLTGDINAGDFVAYITAVTLMMGPSKNLAKINEIIQTGLAAAQSVFTLLDEPLEADTGTVSRDPISGHVEYRHVTFRYPTAKDEALADVSFTIEPGQTLALVGASGSGKTTIGSLLPRFYRVNDGEIFIDGVNINDFVLANLRSHIAVVGQETTLFDDTIRNNIAYGQEQAIDEARLQEAARAAHVVEFASLLPEGFETRVGERGTRLSGGQRQRVAIARAIYKNAPILILDEATSALDAESERYVQEAMQTLRANRTTLVIAHRLSTIEHADRIIVMARGQVVETGTHKELLARGGAYAALYRQQFAEN